jgi:hypothetical protein
MSEARGAVNSRRQSSSLQRFDKSGSALVVNTAAKMVLNQMQTTSDCVDVEQGEGMSQVAEDAELLLLPILHPKGVELVKKQKEFQQHQQM